MGTEITKKVPATAFRFDAGAVQFAQADKASDGRHPVKLLARTFEPVSHWYWGKIIHDFAGMQHNDTITIDYCHDDSEIIGKLDKFTLTDQGLEVQGELVLFDPKDRATEVTHKAKAGVPYEASIDNRGSYKLEEVLPGYTATANGRTVEGPALIFRQWSLRSVAICPHGADSRTKAQFSASAEEVEVTIFSQGDVMKTDTSSAKPAEQPAPTPEKQAAPAQTEANPPLQSSQADDTKPVRDAVKAELQRFTGRFGAEKGALWFTEGKTYEQALELFVTAQGEEIKAAQDEAAKLKEKLGSLKFGEVEPVSGGDGEKGGSKPSAFAAKLGSDGLARYADSLTKPK